VIFSLEQSIENNDFLFDNAGHLWRFLIVYLIFLISSIVFALLPAGGWPYLVIFIGLMLFSNQIIGLSAGTVLLMLTILLGQGSTSTEFFIYFISGLVGIMVFSHVNESFKIWLPMMISLLVQMACLCIREVLFVNEKLNVQMFVVPIANIMVCLILLLIILKVFSFSTFYKKRDIYMDINDPEWKLLVDLKASSKEEYYHAIHTAYLCDRIARRLDMDDELVKACGYYHRIGMLKDGNKWETVQTILDENQFPLRVKEILKEYIDKGEQIISRETVVLLFSDTVISSIQYLFSKNPQVVLDYDKLISAIFKKKIESGIIDQSRISMGEIQEMQKILVEEKLYYDFLR
jgi:membrane-associated HD superfamily phosphohydrolase